jgi:hypothetical protein
MKLLLLLLLLSRLTYSYTLSLGYKIHDRRVICTDTIVDKIRFAISRELNISSSYVSITCDGFNGNNQFQRDT